ncbi:hypothetical protein [Actinacidiphila acididurans]|uniref:Uncharacterized protein n=1 Tax=Actinacidiphila acididurans TaxID=2784346 RepID=A0ABS2U369_9ACTN|nr:hypothetical protein [Actinacidiphila acididurans]MBM9510036.1 hypothetical protein [Actinacidiphila acididurans]
MSTKSARRRRNAAARAAGGRTQKTARPRLGLVKLTKPLPVRTRTVCEDADRRIAHAAIAATERGIPASVAGWHTEGAGEVVQRTDYATVLRHSGTVGDPFTALILCAQGAEHAFLIRGASDLDGARRSTATCTTAHADLHGLDQPIPSTAMAFYGRWIRVHTLQQAKGA